MLLYLQQQAYFSILYCSSALIARASRLLIAVTIRMLSSLKRPQGMTEMISCTIMVTILL